MAASQFPHGVPHHTTPEAAAVDEIYVAGASLRSRDPGIVQLRRQVSNR
jgi:hypothetical protein